MVRAERHGLRCLVVDGRDLVDHVAVVDVEQLDVGCALAALEDVRQGHGDVLSGEGDLSVGVGQREAEDRLSGDLLLDRLRQCVYVRRGQCLRSHGHDTGGALDDLLRQDHVPSVSLDLDLGLGGVVQGIRDRSDGGVDDHGLRTWHIEVDGLIRARCGQYRPHRGDGHVLRGHRGGERGLPADEGESAPGRIGRCIDGRTVVLHDRIHRGTSCAVEGDGVLVDLPRGRKIQSVRSDVDPSSVSIGIELYSCDQMTVRIDNWLVEAVDVTCDVPSSPGSRGVIGKHRRTVGSHDGTRCITVAFDQTDGDLLGFPLDIQRFGQRLGHLPSSVRIGPSLNSTDGLVGIAHLEDDRCLESGIRIESSKLVSRLTDRRDGERFQCIRVVNDVEPSVVGSIGLQQGDGDLHRDPLRVNDLVNPSVDPSAACIGPAIHAAKQGAILIEHLDPIDGCGVESIEHISVPCRQSRTVCRIYFNLIVGGESVAADRTAVGVHCNRVPIRSPTDVEVHRHLISAPFTPQIRPSCDICDKFAVRPRDGLSG